uniref:Sorting nexin C-terminal domain-containing protein n=1 Tax=Gouania willdenowi TaxID=441366 RepID=A0A8C5EKC1_GOUWI
MDLACDDVGDYSGWVRHARAFFPRCLARENIACDVDEVLWPDPTRRRDAQAHTAVADVTLNILCLLMKDQWSWLCTENIQKTIRLLFGTFIERWLDVGVAHLTSAPCWVIYLQVLQEAVWPGGMLPSHPQPERSCEEVEKTKEQCLDCLMQLLPGIHLIFCICDLLLEFLVPESSDESFQRCLLQSLVKDL